MVEERMTRLHFLGLSHNKRYEFPFYFSEHMHGQDICEIDAQKVENIYEDWLDLVDGKEGKK